MSKQSIVSIFEHEFTDFYDYHFGKFEIDNNYLIINTRLMIPLTWFLYWLTTTTTNIIGLKTIDNAHKIMIDSDKKQILIDQKVIDTKLLDDEFQCNDMSHWFTDEYIFDPQSFKDVSHIIERNNMRCVSQCYKLSYKYSCKEIVQTTKLNIKITQQITNYKYYGEYIIYLKNAFRRIKRLIDYDINFIIILNNNPTLEIKVGEEGYHDLNIVFSVSILPRYYFAHTIGYDIDILNGFYKNFHNKEYFSKWAKMRWDVAYNDNIYNNIYNLILKSINNKTYIYH